MNLTINTDASCDESLCIGAYAFWIVTDQGKIQKAAELKTSVQTSTEAELKSICYALHSLKHSKFTGITKVFINTDSKNAIGIIDGTYGYSKKHGGITEVVKEIKFLMLEILLKFGMTVRDSETFYKFQHVKAHNGKKRFKILCK